jgi:hypothetical protein
MPIIGKRYLIGTAILAGATMLHAQSAAPSTPPNSQPCTTSPRPQPCSAAPSKPNDNGSGAKGSAVDRFPFPGENSAPLAAPPDSPKTVSPSPSTAPAGSPRDRFPFPGENTPAAPQPSPGSSSSSSADPTAFPDDTNAPDADSSGDSKDKPASPGGRRLLKRVNPVGTKLQTPDEREAEDLNVARFYTDQGNLQGAYLRTQDAVKIMPDDAEAHCALAQAAVKLNKRDEAIAEFNACLKLDPAEKEAKNARRELAKLK